MSIQCETNLTGKRMLELGSVSYTVTELKMILKNNQELIKYYKDLNKTIAHFVQEYGGTIGGHEYVLAFPTKEPARIDDIITGNCFWKAIKNDLK